MNPIHAAAGVPVGEEHPARAAGASLVLLFSGDPSPGLADRLRGLVPDVAIDEIDVWHQRELTIEFGVRCLPTAIVVRDGVECDRLTGRAGRRRLARFARGLTALSPPMAPVGRPAT